MLSQKELLILACFRKNARRNLTKVSREIHIPVSTIFDKLKRYEGSLIRKYTSLLNFTELGFDVRVNLIIRADRGNKKELGEYLVKNESVNSVFRINNGYDFLIEAIFRNMKEFQGFSERLEEFKIKGKETFYILDDLKREAFLSEPDLVRLGNS